MTKQMIMRLDAELKDRVKKAGEKKGKNLSELVRKLLEKYMIERDISSYIDDLWNRIGQKLSKINTSQSDIDNVIRKVR